MSTYNHTAITTGAAANAATINAPLGTLDAAIGNLTSLPTTPKTSVAGAVGGTALGTAATTLSGAIAEHESDLASHTVVLGSHENTLDLHDLTLEGHENRMDALQTALVLGGSAVTLSNGAASAGQKVVVVDSTTSFVAGCRVEYALAGGVLERNTVASVDSSTQLTLTTNIGAGGIADNTLITMLPIALYNATVGVCNARDYGAVGDGVTDDTAAIQASLNALADNGRWLLPPGNYKTTAVLTVSTKRRVTMDFQGRITALNCSGILFSNVWQSDIVGLDIYRALTASKWADNYYAVKVTNYRYNHCRIKMLSGFTKGIWCAGATNSDVSYAWFDLGLIYACQYGIYFTVAGSGWTNEITFCNGEITLDDSQYVGGSGYTGDWGVYVEPTPTLRPDNIRLIGTSFEKLHNGTKWTDAVQVLLDHCRFESVDASFIDNPGEEFTWIPGFPGIYDSKLTTMAGAKALTMLGGRVSYVGGTTNRYRGINMEGHYGGLFWFHRYSLAHGVAMYLPEWARTPRIVDTADSVLYLNRLYAQALPVTTGAYEVGDVVWNTSAAAGQMAFVVCATAGTCGTLAGVTANTTNGSNVITVNDATNLRMGHRIAVSGSGVASARIDGIAGTTITLGSVMTATLMGAAVAFVAPTWTNGPYIGDVLTGSQQIIGSTLTIYDASVLGAEILTNPSFDANTTGWTAQQSTLSSVAGGQTNNCLQVANAVEAYSYAWLSFTTTPGSRYVLTIYHKNGIGGGSIKIGTSQGASNIYSSGGLSDANWALKTVLFTATGTTTYLALQNDWTTIGRTTLWDTASIKLVTGGKVLAQGGIGVGNSVAATTPGSVTRKIEVFDAAGNSLGFVPVYSSIS